ncbi:MAG: AraC family protein [Rhodobacteraceae bacterium HLUCCA08]|nr:MAG: AraC family protein [Rhodobacteraceae bacterium HLUCCA08]
MPTLPIPVFVALLLAFAFLRLCFDQRRLTTLGLLLALCAVQSMIIALAQHYMVAGLRYVQPVTAAAVPPVAWLAYNFTAVRPAARTDLLHGLVPLLALSALVVAPTFLDVILPAAFVGYGIAILVQALHGSDAQPQVPLGHGNAPSWIWLMIGVALIGSALSDVLIVLAQAMGRTDAQGWIITVFSVGNLFLIGLFALSPYLRTERPEIPESAGRSEEPDSELWNRLQVLIATRKPYLDPNLTLAQLARKLRVPAKSLSAAINRSTGQNVSRFVNEERIRHAQSLLLSGETVTEAMLASGFNTKSNFNREFLRVVGRSPSDWLKSARAANVDGRLRHPTSVTQKMAPRE